MSIGVEHDDARAIVTVDRPDAMNALDVATLTELRDRLQQFATDACTRVVVLTGAGDRAFIAGADIKYMSALDVTQAKAWRALGHETNAVYEPQELMANSLDTARALAKLSPLALAAAKAAANRALQGDHGDNLSSEADHFGELFASEDAREGLSAFVEKREAHFTGR